MRQLRAPLADRLDRTGIRQVRPQHRIAGIARVLGARTCLPPFVRRRRCRGLSTPTRKEHCHCFYSSAVSQQRGERDKVFELGTNTRIRAEAAIIMLSPLLAVSQKAGAKLDDARIERVHPPPNLFRERVKRTACPTPACSSIASRDIRRGLACRNRADSATKCPSPPREQKFFERLVPDNRHDRPRQATAHDRWVRWGGRPHR